MVDLLSLWSIFLACVDDAIGFEGHGSVLFPCASAKYERFGTIQVQDRPVFVRTAVLGTGYAPNCGARVEAYMWYQRPIGFAHGMWVVSQKLLFPPFFLYSVDRAKTPSQIQTPWHRIADGETNWPIPHNNLYGFSAATSAIYTTPLQAVSKCWTSLTFTAAPTQAPTSTSPTSTPTATPSTTKPTTVPTPTPTPSTRAPSVAPTPTPCNVVMNGLTHSKPGYGCLGLYIYQGVYPHKNSRGRPYYVRTFTDPSQYRKCGSSAQAYLWFDRSCK